MSLPWVMFKIRQDDGQAFLISMCTFYAPIVTRWWQRDGRCHSNYGAEHQWRENLWRQILHTAV